MPIPAIAAIVARVAASAGTSGASAAGSRAAAGAASNGARAAGSRAATGGSSKVDKFHALFGEKPDGSKLPDAQNPHLNSKGDEEEEEKTKKPKKSPFDQFADKFAQSAQNIENAAHNRFLPILEDVLPSGFGKLVTAVAGVTNAFIERGKELKNYSAELSNADAIVQMRGVMSDIKEAREIGGNTARMTLASDSIYNDIKEILLPIKRYITGALANFLENLSNFIAFFKPAVVVQQEILSTILTVINETANLEFTKAKQEIEKLPERIAKAMQKKGDDDMMEQFIRNMMQMPFAPLGNNQPVNNAPQLGPNLPLFQGI